MVTTQANVIDNDKIYTSSLVQTQSAIRFKIESNQVFSVSKYDLYKQAISLGLNIPLQSVNIVDRENEWTLTVSIVHEDKTRINQTIESILDLDFPQKLFKIFLGMNLHDTFMLDPDDTLYLNTYEINGVHNIELQKLPIPLTSRIPCENWNPCNQCPYGYSRGCSGRTLWLLNRMNGVSAFVSKRVATGLYRDYCVFHNTGQWMYCPEDPIAALVLTWQLIFTLIINKPTLNSNEIDLYRVATAQVLNINETQIIAGLLSSLTSSTAARRLLQSSTYLGMIVNLNSDQNLNDLSNYVRSQQFQYELDVAVMRLNLYGIQTNPNSVEIIYPYNLITQNLKNYPNYQAASVDSRDVKQNEWQKILYLTFVCVIGSLMMGLVAYSFILCLLYPVNTNKYHWQYYQKILEDRNY
jgi:hypothetical protein